MEIISLANYSIYIGDIWPAVQQSIKMGNYSGLYVLVDENTAEHCLPILRVALSDYEFEVIQIESGEERKNLDTCSNIWEALKNKEANRKSLLINLGGGVIGDIGGFCAATYMRGIDFIQIPTTLLSQVDSSIGGKLGIDFKAYKNFVGLFKDPKAVFIYSPFLETLPERE
ncbi:MAG: iron-containing alcohol dehydrogenase, partial [Bacteroidota bacterium]